MEFRKFQTEAYALHTKDLAGTDEVLHHLLGLGCAYSLLLKEMKRNVRGVGSLGDERGRVKNAIGDVLHYVAVYAVVNGIDLDDAATENLLRAREMFEDTSNVTGLANTRYDRICPESERFPDRLIFSFATPERQENKDYSQVYLVDAKPNPFPNGRVKIGKSPSGKEKYVGFEIGQPIGDKVDDNVARSDGYRYHDALHMSFMANLGWSPTLRGFLRLKRKSVPRLDQTQDCKRAIDAEEAMSAFLKSKSHHAGGFLTPESISMALIHELRQMATDHQLEVADAPARFWKKAVFQGFEVMRKLKENNGGYAVADVKNRDLRFHKWNPLTNWAAE